MPRRKGRIKFDGIKYNDGITSNKTSTFDKNMFLSAINKVHNFNHIGDDIKEVVIKLEDYFKNGDVDELTENEYILLDELSYFLSLGIF